MDHDLGLGELTDRALSQEIELVGALVAAASGSAHRLPDHEIDTALGVGTPSAP
ncbi:hypothetical protein [Lapillicoccus jejuensis]|uniref:Uncharacterized protein n=1 Tax=Lapillicoccus jejuensis TaxID=402171 RepID=A0A542DXH9_9MICO|nr:hypothetical protein [Lapillicoccus jejuensis]TQJ07788.1 hypothetical protein FB458_0856 [Lapillicoccus jejuensis]